MRWRLAPRAFALAAMLALAPPAGTEARAETGAAAQAQAAAESLQQAIKDLQTAKGADDRVAALTRTIQAYEQGLGALRAGLRRATLREAALQAELAAKRDRISRLLGVLTAVQRTPAPVLLLHPAGPLAAVRAAMVVQDVTPGLEAEADRLRNELRELARLHAVQEESAKVLHKGIGAIQSARLALSEAVSNRTDLPRRLTESAAQLKHIAASVKSLGTFARALAAHAPGPGPELPDFTAAKGRLPLPVDGTLLRRAGEADAAGIRRPGLILATAPRALVTTPWAATIRYLGPLLDYKNVIILEPSAGYLLVLAGLDTVYGKVGQVISAGDPVGLMGGQDTASGGDQQGGGAERPETLYMELRHDGKPVDPAPWFAGTRE